MMSNVYKDLRSKLGNPSNADHTSMADAREMFSRLLDWMADAGEDWLLDKEGATWFLNCAKCRLKNEISRQPLALTAPEFVRPNKS